MQLKSLVIIKFFSIFETLVKKPHKPVIMQAELSVQEPQKKTRKKGEGKYIHYGCGLTAPAEWINFDVSPTLRIQHIPGIGSLLKKKLHVVFPDNVKYGNIVNGLPGIEENSCDGIFCSHILEHLSLNDFRKALKNTYKILKPGGIFRCVVPDLEYAAREYIRALDEGNADASISFLGNSTLLGQEHRHKKLKGLLTAAFGNSHHLWMWDSHSLYEELKKAGFKDISHCAFHDCEDTMFDLVEDEHRFENAVAFECKKLVIGHDQ